LGDQNDNPTNCFFITFICSLESLLGVLYSGFCGAILFGKVLRIQSHAQVIFSDPIVIRYGSGVMQNKEFDDDDGAQEGEGGKIPCPVLEFRIVNRLFQEVGGEIMDATLNVVANLNANDADPSLLTGSIDVGQQGYGDSIHNEESAGGGDGGSEDVIHSINSIRANTFRSTTKVFDPFATMISKHEHDVVDKDPSARLTNKHIFSKLIIEASDHPFFKRVWLARHHLDETSPVLKPRIRRLIRRNGGYWPERLNSFDAVRSSLQFNQILVSLNGVSNVSASDVYAQKMYDFVDINVGYQFVNILFRAADGSLGVDLDLLNDVKQQAGHDGGEPLLPPEA